MEGKKYLGDLVKQYHERSGLSYSQIEKKTGVPAKTVTSWARGLSKRPRRWQDLVSFAAGLGLLHAEVDELLDVTRHPSISELRKSTVDEADQKLLSHWDDSEPIFQVRRGTVNYRGRVEAQTAVKTALESEEQLCVIQGMGGIGKSTLAIELATQLQTKYRDGVLWGDLRLMSNDEVLDSWASLIGIPFPQSASAEAKATNMWGVLSRKSFLIVLDDAVSLTQVRQLLPPHQTECGLLVTTRDKEVANSLVNNSENIVSLAPMRPETSMALFEDVLGSSYIEKHSKTLAKIAVVLGHLPLALNIYARRQKSSSQSPQAALERMVDIQRKLTALKVGDEAVRTAFEQSWELLEPATQAGFKQMAIFAGRDFGIDAFTEIGQFNLFDAEDILDQLQRLFLISPWGDTGKRFQQHTLLAAWSHELLHDERSTENEKQEPFQRMSEYYLGYAKEHLEEEQALTMEWGNIMGGMQASSQLEANELTLEYLDALESYWLRKGYYTDAREGYSYGVQAAEHLEDDAKKAWLHLGWGSACVEQKNISEALKHLLVAQRYMTENKVINGLGKVEMLTAKAHRNLENFAEAKQHLLKAWAHFQETENANLLATTLTEMGKIFYNIGDISDAIRIGEDALKSFDQVDNPLEHMRCLILIAMGYDKLREYKKSQLYYDRLKSISKELIDRIEISEFYYAYAQHLMNIQNFEEAIEFTNKSIEQFRICGDQISEANAFYTLTLISVEKHKLSPEARELDNARETANKALSIFTQFDNKLGIVSVEYILGRVLYYENKIDDACKQVRSCLAKAKQLQNTSLINDYTRWLNLVCQQS